MTNLKFIYSKGFILFLFAFALLIAICFDGLELMVKWWEKEEYSHGYLIPLVALYLIWQRREELLQKMKPGSWLGVFFIILSLCLWFLGELSAIYTVIQYAFWVGLWGLALVWLGVSGVRVVWAGIFYLFFMIPLPNFLYFNLSQKLQLISSELGVAFIRLFDISVYLAGNVIDLGVYRLQVVEACSGLRYLFPLMSFGFLMAYIYKGALWQRVIIFLSTIPITVLMNSFRIGVIGVTVEHFGIAAAEGFLHDFEGWIVFVACLGVLLLEIWILHMIFGNKDTRFGDLFDLDFGANKQLESSKTATELPGKAFYTSMIISLLILILVLPASKGILNRQNVAPERELFSQFPLLQGEWKGRESSLDQQVLNTLKLTDYITAKYQRTNKEPHIGFYAAWYESQSKGASIHSPKSCLPGGGWVVQSHTQKIVSLESGESINVNQIVMQMGDVQQLVYYWFDGRGRDVTNEYLNKWFVFWDALTKNRTDGALVRLITYIPEGTGVEDAEKRLNQFLSDFQPLIIKYIPD